jgi:hypothetical protein
MSFRIFKISVYHSINAALYIISFRDPFFTMHAITESISNANVYNYLPFESFLSLLIP